MKKEQVTPEFIESIKPKVQRTAKKIIVFNVLTFVEHKYYNNCGESNYIIFSAWNPKLACSQRVTYDVEHDAIDISVWRTKCD